MKMQSIKRLPTYIIQGNSFRFLATLYGVVYLEDYHFIIIPYWLDSTFVHYSSTHMKKFTTKTDIRVEEVLKT